MISLQQIHYSYDKKPFIRDLNLKLEKGRITAITGPNGCGKSTVLKLASGLLQPQQGQILFQGREISTMSGREYARKVSLVQQNQLKADMTVDRLVMAGRYPHQGMMAAPGADDREMVERALEMTGCGSLRRKNLRHLSGGELQRAYLAMAVAQDTELIFLDEPTAHLDMHVCHEMMELVNSLKTRWGKTVVMVLHDLNLALQYSERLVVMYQGQVMAAGGSEKVLKSGVIQQVFSVELRRFTTGGKEYYCFDSVSEKRKVSPYSVAENR